VNGFEFAEAAQAEQISRIMRLSDA